MMPNWMAKGQEPKKQKLVVISFGKYEEKDSFLTVRVIEIRNDPKNKKYLSCP